MYQRSTEKEAMGSRVEACVSGQLGFCGPLSHSVTQSQFHPLSVQLGRQGAIRITATELCKTL